MGAVSAGGASAGLPSEAVAILMIMVSDATNK